MFEAGFHDLAGETLSDLNCFSDTAALGDQSRNVGTRPEVATVLKLLDADADGHFFNFRDVLLPLHRG